MKPSLGFNRAEKLWVRSVVRCFIRDLAGRKIGPYVGIVHGLSSNQAEAELQDRSVFHPTGLLVRIPELGHHSSYGEWPVNFGDAEMIVEKTEQYATLSSQEIS